MESDPLISIFFNNQPKLLQYYNITIKLFFDCDLRISCFKKRLEKLPELNVFQGKKTTHLPQLLCIFRF